MTSTPDVWDAQDCGLISGPALDLLSGVHTIADGPQAPDGATTYMVGEPAYVPYRSTTMPCPDDGYEMAEHVMRAIHSPELRESVRTSPLADIADRTTAAQARALWRTDATPAARGLARLAQVAPRKGGEMQELWGEYRRRVPGAQDPIMAMRDLWGSAYAWQFIRGTDARLHDLSGSILSLTSAVDYCDASDDSGAGGQRLYMRAASEGLVHLSGPAATQAVKDVVAVGGMMAVKDALVKSDAGGDALADSAPVTPQEYVRARSWDGAVAPYYRLMLSTTDYRHLSDTLGVFTSASRCHVIQRATDNVMRYNDITDAVADYVHRESFNELLLALSVRGHCGVTGFGAALAELTDAVLECRCGQAGHDEAAEMSMGTCLWYLLIPRYNVRRQLAAFSQAGGALARAYAMPAPGDRARSAACTLTPGTTLHSPAWDALWQPTGTLSAAERAQRIARRSLVEGTDTRACAAVAEGVLARCERAEDGDGLRALGEGWQQVFDTALTTTGAAGMDHAAMLRTLIDDIWQQAVLGHGTAPGMDARLLMDVDEAMRATFQLATDDGLRLRRAFLGVASGSVELAGLNPYARLADGLSTLCR